MHDIDAIPSLLYPETLSRQYLFIAFRVQFRKSLTELELLSLDLDRTIGPFLAFHGIFRQIVRINTQKIKYHHAILRCNSRLDTLQAAILDVKLKYLDKYSRTHYRAALYYTQQLKGIEGIITPEEMPYSTHVYHQYTLKVRNGKRDALKKFLEEAGIPAMIYYPLPLQQQEAFKTIARAAENLDTAEKLAYSVLSLPIHTEITRE